jgi:site-specific recombinase XerD
MKPARAETSTTGGRRHSIRVQLIEGRFEVFKSDAPLTEAGRFLRALEARGLSAHTVRAYAFDLVVFYRWLEEANETLDTLTAAKLVEFIAAQRRVDAQPNSINRRLATVRSFYGFCTDKELQRGAGIVLPAPHYRGRGRDRVLGLHRILPKKRLQLHVKVPYRLVEPLRPDEVRLFLGRLRRYRDLALVQLLLFCGLRSVEVLRLEIEDVQFQDRRLRILGKGNRERTVPLPDLLASLLRDYLRLERPKSPTPRLFVVMQGPRRGQPMTAAGLRSLFRRRRHNELARANPHRFRHTFGADMARAGVRLPMLQRMMGHIQPTTTLRYINLSLEDLAAEYCRAIAEIKKRYERPS